MWGCKALSLVAAGLQPHQTPAGMWCSLQLVAPLLPSPAGPPLPGGTWEPVTVVVVAEMELIFGEWQQQQPLHYCWNSQVAGCPEDL